MIKLKDRWLLFGLDSISFRDYRTIQQLFEQWDFVKYRSEIIEQVIAENWIL